MVKVMVRALPRLRGIPRIACPEDHEEEDKAGVDTGIDRTAVWASTLPLHSTGSNQAMQGAGPPLIRQPQSQASQRGAEAASERRPSPADRDANKICMQRTSHPTRRRDSPSPTPDTYRLQRMARRDWPTPTTSFQKPSDFGAIPKRKAHKSPPTDYFDHHAMSAPELETLADLDPPMIEKSSSGSSRKVIVTKKVQDREIPIWGSPSVINKDSTDSDTSSPDIDKLLYKTLGSKPEPMTPEEMEDYLSKLCTGSKARTKQASPTELLTPGEQKAWSLIAAEAKPSQTKLSPDQRLSTLNHSAKNCTGDHVHSQCQHKIRPGTQLGSPPNMNKTLPEVSFPRRPLSPKSWLSQQMEHKAQHQHQQQDKVMFCVGPDDEVDEDASTVTEPKAITNGHGLAPEVPAVPVQSSNPTTQSPPFKNRLSDPALPSANPVAAVPSPGSNRASSLLKSVMRRDLAQQLEVQ